jgi:hypothetical protein
MLRKKIKPLTVIRSLFSVALLLVIFLGQAQAAQTAQRKLPLIRGPQVSQTELEAIAEALGGATLSDEFEAHRPAETSAKELKRLLERAQSAWLAGEVESARSVFKDINNLALDADWRDHEREAIHYSILRLAQSAATSGERENWLERAIVLFPDLKADAEIFPPPLVEAFNADRKRVMSGAIEFFPQQHFPDHRYLYINGKQYVLDSDLKILLPAGKFRITAVSDADGITTEKLTTSQLKSFSLVPTPLASGNCFDPHLQNEASKPEALTVIYSSECSRVHDSNGWNKMDLNSTFGTGALGQAKPNTLNSPINSPPPKTNSLLSNPWFWAGVSIIAVGIGVVAYREIEKQNQETE